MINQRAVVQYQTLFCYTFIWKLIYSVSSEIKCLNINFWPSISLSIKVHAHDQDQSLTSALIVINMNIIIQ